MQRITCNMRRVVPPAAGLVLLAPMLSLERLSQKGANKVMRPVADLLSWLIPTAAIVATERNTMYPELQECWDKGGCLGCCCAG